MPYIPKTERHGLRSSTSEEPGKLTYLLYQQCLDSLPFDPHFADYCTVLGALETTKLELYRRHIAPYEDKKREENGDVY